MSHSVGRGGAGGAGGRASVKKGPCSNRQEGKWVVENKRGGW